MRLKMNEVLMNVLKELRRAPPAERVFVPIPFAAVGRGAQPPYRGPRVEDEAMETNDVYIGMGYSTNGLEPIQVAKQSAHRQEGESKAGC